MIKRCKLDTGLAATKGRSMPHGGEKSREKGGSSWPLLVFHSRRRRLTCLVSLIQRPGQVGWMLKKKGLWEENTVLSFLLALESVRLEATQVFDSYLFAEHWWWAAAAGKGSQCCWDNDLLSSGPRAKPGAARSPLWWPQAMSGCTFAPGWCWNMVTFIYVCCEVKKLRSLGIGCSVWEHLGAAEDVGWGVLSPKIYVQILTPGPSLEIQS